MADMGMEAQPPIDFAAALEAFKALIGQGVSTADVNAEMERRAPAQTYQPPPMRVNFEPNVLGGGRSMPSAPEIMARIQSMPAVDTPSAIPQGMALQPQSGMEANALARDAQSVGSLLRMSGVTPAYQAGVAASEGRPLSAAGNAAMAMMPYRPIAGLTTLGAAYGGALASDLGAFDMATASAQQKKGTTSLPGLAPEQQSQYDQLDRRLKAGQFGSGAERRQIEEAMRELRGVSNAYISSQNAARVNLETGAQRATQDEYNRGVERAEAARNAELARDRRFSETNVGRLFDQTGGLAPGVFGVGAGFLSRAATGGGRTLYDYVIPGASGAAAGVTAANVPLVYNALYTEPDNPERRAYEAYGRELPPTHPRRQEFIDYAQRLPTANPVRQEAMRQLYDPVSLAERSGLGAVEGVLGGLAGGELVRIPSRLSGRQGGSTQLAPQTQTPPSAPQSPVSPNALAPQSSPPPESGLANLSTTLRQDRRPPLSTEPAPPRPTGLPQGYQEDSRLPSGVRGPRGRFARDPRKD